MYIILFNLFNLFNLFKWDTAGQERFQTITTSYYRGAHGVVVVYDVTSSDSFSHVKDVWTNQVERYCNENVVKMMVGNKIDAVTTRLVSNDDGAELASKLEYDFYETSAKNSTNVEDMFVHVARKLMSRVGQPTNSANSKLNVDINGTALNNNNTTKCCPI